MSWCIGALKGKPVFIGSIVDHDDAGLLMVRGIDRYLTTLENTYYLFFDVEGVSGSSYKLEWPETCVTSVDCFNGRVD